MHLRVALIPVLLFAASLPAESPATRPVKGITYAFESRKEPPQRLHVLTVDLSDPRLRLRVSAGGADPDGDGPFQTTLMPPTAIAKREGFDLVVNGDFFSIKKDPDKPGYRAAVPASVLGPAMTDGKGWAAASKPRPCIVVMKSGQVRIEPHDQAPADAAQVIAGNVMLLKDGKPVPPENKLKHPRTVAGVTKDGKRLIFLLVEGRRPGVATGMSYEELQAEMLRLGASDALNLDGGGSTLAAIRDPDGSYRVVNTPSDGRERPVANVIGVSAEKR